jgi:hypothetical protein
MILIAWIPCLAGAVNCGVQIVLCINWIIVVINQISYLGMPKSFDKVVIIRTTQPRRQADLLDIWLSSSEETLNVITRILD